MFQPINRDTIFNYCVLYKSLLLEWDLEFGLNLLLEIQIHAIFNPICYTTQVALKAGMIGGKIFSDVWKRFRMVFQTTGKSTSDGVDVMHSAPLNVFY